jgi:hypothetical protein
MNTVINRKLNLPAVNGYISDDAGLQIEGLQVSATFNWAGRCMMLAQPANTN